MTMPLFPQPDLGPVQRGDIFAFGRHRLACIDATDKAAVARLFDGRKPTLVVTSPPYADARAYNDPIPCWDSMMLGALDGHAFADDVQLLVNLGVIHRKGELFNYWANWISLMRDQGWRQFAQYPWYKKMAIPGFFKGRLSPAHEFVFHLNSHTVDINRWVPALRVRKSRNLYSMRNAAGLAVARSDKAALPKPYKAPCSVIEIASVKFGEHCGHPAQMPVALASFLLQTWKKENCVAYDPFAGSGTLAHAAEDQAADALMAEISPAYVQLAIDRWRRMHPDKPVRRLTAPARG